MMKHRQAGFSLVETLVALVLLGTIGAVFLQSLGTTSKSVQVIDERNAAESLAKSHVEYIASQSFSDDLWNYAVTHAQRSSTQQPTWWDSGNPPLLSSEYDRYSVTCNAQDVDIDGDGDYDIGIHKITVSVFHNGEALPVTTLDSYKINR